MKRIPYIVIASLAISVFGAQFSTRAHAGNQTATAGPVIIYYGLNDCHSRSWVQLNEDGIVGITYFQRFEGSDDEGTLIYKTIQPDGSENTDSVTTGTRLEKSVLLYDAASNPHIFVALSDNTDQVIDHYYKNGGAQWQSETIIHFYNEGGKFIYELSADTDPDDSFHLLVLKTRSDVDSDDFWDAWINSHLYHLTNASGVWEKELIHNYDTAWTEDMYIKSSSRQDIKVDDDGYVHVTFSEQVIATETPSRLLYATNKTGAWEIETALNYDYGASDDAGWFPSLCLDGGGTPYISCMYVNRVATLSAMYCKLFLLKRLGAHDWQSEVVAAHDDGYYGGDGRNYTGGLSHLVFDSDNTPHIIFSDIASTHWPGSQLLNVGNIRYGVFENGAWNITTIYRQPLPTGYLNATEMYGLCLTVSEETNTIRVVGQELVVTGANQYTCSLLDFSWDIEDETPTGLRSFNTAVRERGIEISWRLSEAGATGFVILRAEGRGGEFRHLPSPEITREGLSCTFIDNSCEPGRDYYYRVDVLENHEQWTLFETDALSIPAQQLALHQNHPNPFNPTTTISFMLPETSHANLSVYDLEGKLVITLIDGEVEEGHKQITWDGTGSHGNRVSSGVYYYRLQAEKKVLTRKMVLLK
jgi:hypothetical protein